MGHEDAIHPHSYNPDGYNRYSVSFVLDGKSFTGEMLVALSGDRAVFYDIVKIKEDVSPTGTSSGALPETGESTSSTISISQNSGKSTVSEKKIKENGSIANRLAQDVRRRGDRTVSNISIAENSEKSTVSEKKGEKYKILPQVVLRAGG